MPLILVKRVLGMTLNGCFQRADFDTLLQENAAVKDMDSSLDLGLNPYQFCELGQFI